MPYQWHSTVNIHHGGGRVVIYVIATVAACGGDAGPITGLVVPHIFVVIVGEERGIKMPPKYLVRS